MNPNSTKLWSSFVISCILGNTLRQLPKHSALSRLINNIRTNTFNLVIFENLNIPPTLVMVCPGIDAAIVKVMHARNASILNILISLLHSYSCKNSIMIKWTICRQCHPHMETSARLIYRKKSSEVAKQLSLRFKFKTSEFFLEISLR
jgi:hypothetical protein